MTASKRRKTRNGTAETNIASTADTCFTIMPFGGWFDKYYLEVFCPAIKAAGLIPRRTDDLYRPGTITNDIWAYTKEAKIVLADLTGKNPNVFYELGLAHALAKPAVLVAETIDDVPFDLRGLRVIEYDKNSPTWGYLLKEKITFSISEVLKSPLESVLPTFLNVEKGAMVPSVTEYEREILTLKQDIELLRREIQPSRVSRTREVISAMEAEELVRDYLGRGMSYSSIAAHLWDRGVPETFTRRKIEEFKSQFQEPPAGVPTSSGEAAQLTAT